MPVRRLLAVCAFVVLAAGPSAGQTATWNRPGGGSWADPLSWDGGAVPGAAADVVFGGSLAAGGPFLVTLDGTRTANSLLTNAPAGPVRLTAGSGGGSVFRTGGAASGVFGSEVRAAGGSDLFVDVPLEVAGNAYLRADAGRAVGLEQVRLQSGVSASLGFGYLAPGGGRYELGAGGLDLATGTGELTLTGYNSATLSLTASQTWAVGNGRRVYTNREVASGNLPAVDLGPAGRTLTVALTNPGSASPLVQFQGPLLGGGGLTVTGGGALGSGPGAGVVLLGGTAGFGATTATGPLTVTGGTLAPNQPGAWAGTSVSVSGGQLLPGDNQGLPAATQLTLSDTGAYNLGVPNLTTGSMAGVLPRDRGQTFASVGHTGGGAFNTGAAAVTVSGTFTHQAVGGLTVQPGGTLSVNRLDLRPVFTALPGAVTVRTDFTATAQVGTLIVGAGGLNLADRAITLATTANAANFASYLKLTGGDVTASGTCGILAGGPQNAVVNLRSTGGTAADPVAFDVAAGGTLTVSATLANGDFVPGAGSNAPSGFVKKGAGTMVLGGANQFTLGVRIDAGRLVVGSAGAFPANPGSITLNGGTLSTAGGAGGAGVTERGGRLLVTAGSTIELGTGPHSLSFPVLGTGFGPSVPAGSLLTVTGWQGPEFGPGTAGRLFISDNPGLDADTLGRIQFVGYPLGAARVFVSGQGFELVPVPEPAAGLAVAAAGLLLARRRILAG